MPDLLIGARRSPTVSRPWRAGAIALALLGVAATAAWFVFRRSVAYDQPLGTIVGEVVEQAATGTHVRLGYGDSSLEWIGGIAVLRTVGDDTAIGAAYGRLLGPVIRPMVEALRPSIDATVPRRDRFDRLTHAMRLAWRWRFIDAALGERDVRMVAGAVRGAGASGIALAFPDLLRAQAVLDVGLPAAVSGELVAPSHGLTAIAQQAQMPSRLWIGRTFSLAGVADGGDAAMPIVHISHPAGLIASASIAVPGQFGVVTGINEHRIAVMVNLARTRDVRATNVARPCASLARTILEQAKTLDEAVAIVDQTPTLGSGVFVIAEGSTGKWALIERTPTKSVVERSPSRQVVGNVLAASAFATDPDNDRARRNTPATARIDRAAQLVSAPVANAAAMAEVLRDQRGLDGNLRPPGHRGVIDDGRDIQAIILDPTAMELWVTDPSASGRMRAFDLRYELRGEGDRAAPPADIAADPNADPNRASALRVARAELRTARAAVARGDVRAGSEACARARAMMPRLPEALELCAAIAQARGDVARAQQLYQRWVSGTPDNPQGEQTARVLVAR